MRNCPVPVALVKVRLVEPRVETNALVVVILVPLAVVKARPPEKKLVEVPEANKKLSSVFNVSVALLYKLVSRPNNSPPVLVVLALNERAAVGVVVFTPTIPLLKTVKSLEAVCT